MIEPNRHDGEKTIDFRIRILESYLSEADKQRRKLEYQQRNIQFHLDNVNASMASWNEELDALKQIKEESE